MSDLVPLFQPKSVALIGASSNSKKYGYWTAKSLVENKFEGDIYLVSRSGGELFGHTTYPDILSVPGDVDLAILAIAPKFILPVMEQCVEKGVNAPSLFPPALAKSVLKEKNLNARCSKSPARVTCACRVRTAWVRTVPPRA